MLEQTIERKKRKDGNLQGIESTSGKGGSRSPVWIRVFGNAVRGDENQLGVTENSELYRLGDTGGFYRKADSELIHRTFKRHAEERKNAIFTKSGINAEYVQSMFYYEMCNHEFGINWDGTADVLSACDITMEQLNSTPELKQAWNAAKNQYYAAAEKNGWF